MLVAGCDLVQIPACASVHLSINTLSSTIHIERSSYVAAIYEPVHEISNNLLCATNKASDQPAHTRSLIGAFACRLNIL